jgi:hypothetical protein
MPATITSDNIGQSVQFSVYPVGFLGNNFKNAKILAVFDAETASAFIDVVAMHANVYPSLPSGYALPGKQNTYNYVRLRLQDGQFTVLGIPWIDMSTFEVIELLKCNLVVNDILPSQVQRLRNALISNGFTNFELEQVALS